MAEDLDIGGCHWELPFSIAECCQFFVTSGRINRDTRPFLPLPPLSFRLPSSSLKSPSHHFQEQFALKKTGLRSQIKLQGKDQTINRRQGHRLTCKLQVRSHARLGPGSRTAEEVMHARETHPSIAADLLLPVPFFVSETPSGFHPGAHHHTIDHLA